MDLKSFFEEAYNKNLINYYDITYDQDEKGNFYTIIDLDIVNDKDYKNLTGYSSNMILEFEDKSKITNINLKIINKLVQEIKDKIEELKESFKDRIIYFAENLDFDSFLLEEKTLIKSYSEYSNFIKEFEEFKNYLKTTKF